LCPLINNIYRKWENNRCVLFDTYLGKGLEVAQLDGRGLRLENLGGIGQLLRGFELALCVNDLGAALTFGFGLFGNGTLHRLGNVHLFHFDLADLDAPGLGVLVQDDLQFGVDFVALRKNFVELELADDAAKGGLGQLRSSVLIILHLRHGQVGVDHTEIAHGVYFYGHVVAGDDVLRWNVKRFQAQVDAIQGLNRPKHEVYASGLRINLRLETLDVPPQ